MEDDEQVSGDALTEPKPAAQPDVPTPPPPALRRPLPDLAAAEEVASSQLPAGADSLQGAAPDVTLASEDMIPAIWSARLDAAGAHDTGPTKLSKEKHSDHPKLNPLVGATLDDKYHLVGILGQGAMGTVFKGVHLALGITVAVKVMKAEAAIDNDYIRRFRREAQAMSALTHANIVRVLDFGFSKVFYIVMEFVEGESAGDWLHRLTEPPDLVVVKDLMLQLCDGLEAAHLRGIVHRDLKPDNLMLTIDETGRCILKVTDFGLAHYDDPRDGEPTLTKEGSVAGTPYYMSPEQCRSLAVGPSTDLYALGCLLTSFLQLEPPFVTGSAMEVMSAQMFAPPPPLSRPDASEEMPSLLERLRLRLLAKQTHQRPRTVAEVRQQLLEAFSPELSAKRLPPRKGALGDGGRSERSLTSEAGRLERISDPGPNSDLIQARMLSAPDAQSVDQPLITGLGSLGIQLKQVDDFATASSAEVVILSCAADQQFAVRWLTAASASMPTVPKLVCIERPSPAELRALVEAGAAEVTNYPPSTETLGRSVRRLKRRAGLTKGRAV